MRVTKRVFWKLLVAWADCMVVVEGDYEAVYPPKSVDFTAIGSGTPYALGSLFSTQGDTRQRLETALSAAAKFSGIVKPPFFYRNT